MEPIEIQQQLTRELTGPERLIWSGQPRQGLFLRGADAALIPFSLLWAGFAFFWEGSVIKGNAPLFFKLWGIPFVLVGIYILIGRFFVDARVRKTTAYGVTSERVLIVSTFPKKTVKSIPLRSLSELSLSEAGDGSGTITLGPASGYAWAAQSSWPGSRRAGPPVLEGIPQVRTVYQTICEAQKTAV